MDKYNTKSWVYILVQTELHRFANAFNINATRIVPVVRDRIVGNIKCRTGNKTILWEEDETLGESQSVLRDD